jgi:hypothetical protein
MRTHASQPLRIALIAIGIAFLLGYPLMLVWPSGWAWQPGQYEYEQMIVGIYATLGVFHGGIMAVQAVVDPAERGHLPGDVAALFLVAAVLGVLTPRGVTTHAVHQERAA